ncbi:MAG TPA: alkaline phosphatase family protein [Dysgonamonadaceae bacterium]|nr:alkaline phosphatase family protein [Dysgonamonadaceae bacterium]
MKKALFCLLFISLFIAHAEAKTRKAVFIIVDGVPADQLERLSTPAISEITSKGAYAHAYTGGEVGAYTETPTISAPGYSSLLTATWAYKHNVRGNSNLRPNYNYWSPFRIAKEQKKDYKTGLFSSWTDNRTVLMGEGKNETNNLKIDYIKDGYDNDTNRFPEQKDNMHIFEIDELVSKEAANSIRNEAPDLSWIYLWYTDDVGHMYGNSDIFDEFVVKADHQVARIWEAVKYRKANFDEEWMIVVTTDHGRTEDGKDHGGQSLRERTIWISTNVEVNEHFNSDHLAIIDILPSIYRYMNFSISNAVKWEQDGVPFIGQTDIYNLSSQPISENNSVQLSWNAYTKEIPVEIYASTTNNYKEGKSDEWLKVATVSSEQKEYTVDLNTLPTSELYKFVVRSPNNHLNRWVSK